MGIFIYIRTVSYKDFPGGPLAKTLHSQGRGPDQGSRPHMPQLKISYFTTETWKYLKKKRRIGRIKKKKKKNYILCAIHTHSHIYTHTTWSDSHTKCVPKDTNHLGKEGFIGTIIWEVAIIWRVIVLISLLMALRSPASPISSSISQTWLPHGTLAFGAFTYKYPPELVVYLASFERFGSEMLGISC